MRDLSDENTSHQEVWSSLVEKGEKCCDVLLSLSWVMLVAVVEFVCFMTAQSKIASVGIYTGVVIVML